MSPSSQGSSSARSGVIGTLALERDDVSHRIDVAPFEVDLAHLIIVDQGQRDIAGTHHALGNEDGIANCRELVLAQRDFNAVRHVYVEVAQHVYRLLPSRIVGIDDARDERMTHDVGPLEVDEGDVVDAIEHATGRVEAVLAKQVALRGVARHHELR